MSTDAKRQYDFDRAVSRAGTNCLKWDATKMVGGREGLLPFWIADMDLPVMDEVGEAVRRRTEHPVYGYEFVPPACLDAIRQWYARRHGLALETEWMLPGCGVMEFMAQTVLTLTEPGDQILIFTPIYTPMRETIVRTGRTVVEHPFQEQDGAYHIDFALLEQQLQQGVKAILFCNPHNPTAKVWTRAECARLAELCAHYGVYMFSDEVHGDFGLFGNRYTSMAAFEEIRDRVVVYTAPSKTFNLAGLRVSVTIVPGEEAREKLRQATSAMFMDGMCSLAIPAVTAAYTHGDAWMDQVLAYIEDNARFVSDYFAREFPAIHAMEHQGSFLMWLDCRAAGHSGREMQQGMAAKGILIDDGRRYGDNGEGFIRLNIACPRAQLRQGVEIMAAWLKENA